MFPLTFSRQLGRSTHLLTRNILFNVPVCSLGSSTSKRILTKRSDKKPGASTTTNSKFSESDINFSTLDPDKFGDLFEQYGDARSRGPLKSEEGKDDEDGYDKLEIKRGVKKSIGAYMRIMNELRRQRPPNVAQMLELHQQFIYEDRYIPDKMLYSLLIDACAQVGFTRKAVQLYEEMRMFQLKPTKSTVTGLFNACANCTHTSQYGLQQAGLIREKLQLDGYEFNDIQYNVLIKTFARLGDMATAKAIKQEMADKGHTVSLETYSMLLMGCISNKKQGLLEATYLMHQILKSSSQLDLPVINLFLRCIRDCEMSKEDLQQISSSPLIAAKGHQLLEAVASQNGQSDAVVRTKQPSDIEKSSLLATTATNPNLLTGANVEQIISIDFASLSRPANRFLLFGGVHGFTQLMDSNGIKPSLKTITMFIDLMYTRESFSEVERLLKRYNLKADVYLYNVLLKKVAKTGNNSLCREILQSMQNELIQPDIMTFGALTFACTDAKRAKRLLGDMFRCNIVLNDKILGNLINIACSEQDLEYVSFLLEYIERNRLSLSRIDVEQIDLLLKKTKQEIAANERKDVSIGAEYKKNYELISYRFRELLKSSTIEVSAHPWKQFEATPRKSQKTAFNAFAKAMKQKTDIKMRKEKPQVADYNDEIDP